MESVLPKPRGSKVSNSSVATPESGHTPLTNSSSGSFAVREPSLSRFWVSISHSSGKVTTRPSNQRRIVFSANFRVGTSGTYVNSAARLSCCTRTIHNCTAWKTIGQAVRRRLRSMACSTSSKSVVKAFTTRLRSSSVIKGGRALRCVRTGSWFQGQ